MASLRTTRNSLNRSYVDQSLLSLEFPKEISIVDDSSMVNGDINGSNKRNFNNSNSENEISPKKKKKIFEPPKIEGNVDIFCWRCHRPGDCIICSTCPRVYHLKCAQVETKPTGFWPCIECDSIQRAEAVSARGLTVGILSELLSYALERMKGYLGSEHFCTPVDTETYSNYKDYVLKPMDMSQLDANIRSRQYGSTESFLSDAKWMVHNSYIYNSAQSYLTITARGLLKVAKQECEEIDNCHYCYRHAHTLPPDRWFIEPCEKPHLLIWARLKGFPFWPAKVMRLTGQGVDVRFFGDHNRSIVSPATCLLYSRKRPFRARDVKGAGPSFERALEEIETHILKLETKFKSFEYGEFRTELNPSLLDEYIAKMLPKCDISRIKDNRIRNEDFNMVSEQLNKGNVKRKLPNILKKENLKSKLDKMDSTANTSSTNDENKKNTSSTNDNNKKADEEHVSKPNIINDIINGMLDQISKTNPGEVINKSILDQRAANSETIEIKSNSVKNSEEQCNKQTQGNKNVSVLNEVINKLESDQKFVSDSVSKDVKESNNDTGQKNADSTLKSCITKADSLQRFFKVKQIILRNSEGEQIINSKIVLKPNNVKAIAESLSTVEKTCKSMSTNNVIDLTQPVNKNFEKSKTHLIRKNFRNGQSIIPQRCRTVPHKKIILHSNKDGSQNIIRKVVNSNITNIKSLREAIVSYKKLSKYKKNTTGGFRRKIKKYKQKKKSDKLFQHVNPISFKKFRSNTKYNKHSKKSDCKNIGTSQIGTPNSCEKTCKVDFIQKKSFSDNPDKDKLSNVSHSPKVILKNCYVNCGKRIDISKYYLDYNKNIENRIYPKIIEGVNDNADPVHIPDRLDNFVHYSLNVRKLTDSKLAGLLGSYKYLHPKVKLKKLSEKEFYNYFVPDKVVIEEIDSDDSCDSDDDNDGSTSSGTDELTPEEILKIIGVNSNSVNVNVVDELPYNVLNQKHIRNQSEVVAEKNILSSVKDYPQSSINFRTEELAQPCNSSNQERNHDSLKMSKPVQDSSDLEAENKKDFKSSSPSSFSSIGPRTRMKTRLKTPPAATEDIKQLHQETCDLLDQLSTISDLDEAIDLVNKKLNVVLLKSVRHIEEAHNTVAPAVVRETNFLKKRNQEVIDARLKEIMNKDDEYMINLKRKQWCALCAKEAKYHCCFLASYCSYGCQEEHWQEHYKNCCQFNYKKEAVDSDISENKHYDDLASKSTMLNPVYVNELIALQENKKLLYLLKKKDDDGSSYCSGMDETELEDGDGEENSRMNGETFKELVSIDDEQEVIEVKDDNHVDGNEVVEGETNKEFRKGEERGDIEEVKSVRVEENREIGSGKKELESERRKMINIKNKEAILKIYNNREIEIERGKQAKREEVKEELGKLGRNKLEIRKIEEKRGRSEEGNLTIEKRLEHHQAKRGDIEDMAQRKVVDDSGILNKTVISPKTASDSKDPSTNLRTKVPRKIKISPLNIFKHYSHILPKLENKNKIVISGKNLKEIINKTSEQAVSSQNLPKTLANLHNVKVIRFNNGKEVCKRNQISSTGVPSATPYAACLTSPSSTSSRPNEKDNMTSLSSYLANFKPDGPVNLLCSETSSGSGNHIKLCVKKDQTPLKIRIRNKNKTIGLNSDYKYSLTNNSNILFIRNEEPITSQSNSTKLENGRIIKNLTPSVSIISRTDTPNSPKFKKILLPKSKTLINLARN